MLMQFHRQPVPFSRQFKFVLWLFFCVTIIELVNIFSGRSLNQFGIIPRETYGLLGILSAPFIHGNMMHFAGNLVPLLLFTLLVFQHGWLRFWSATFGIVILGGLGVWLFARPAIHIGASGVIFGYFGFLVVAGIISREIKLLAIAILVGFFYGGLLWGVLPVQRYVSFESHLFGLIAGVLMAFLIGRARKT